MGGRDMGGGWRQGALGLGSVALLLGSVAGTAAQSGSPVDALAASLLTVEDLPPGLTSQGITEPPAFDIDDVAFAANDGQRVIGQVWSRQDVPPLVVFDLRMELPDAAAAAAYLDAAEPTLSEADVSGLAPVMFGEPIGEDGRYYFGVTEAGDLTIQLHDYLFHVGPVAAKVFIGGTDLPADLPAAIASAAAARIEAASSGEPGSSPAASASASPSASGSPSASLSGPLGMLLAHVPASVRDTCAQLEPSGSEIAGVACTSGSGTPVLYALYGNGIAVDGDFARIIAGIATPHAATCAEGPYVGEYEVAGEVVGQLACWVVDGTAYIVAGDKRIPMVVFLLGEDGDLAALERALPELAPLP